MANSHTVKVIIALLVVVVATITLYWVDPEPYRVTLVQGPPTVVRQMLKGSDFIGSGQVNGPEDIVYEPGSRVLYTGCEDGWIKRVKLDESMIVVEDWVNTGGRPLGLASSSTAEFELIVADAYKGLLKITEAKEVKLLSNEADGQRFKLTDGVDVAKDGTIYFTDASYKYGLEEHLYDILGNKPYGRLLNFNPKTGETKTLVQHLYFANGVAVSPDQNSLIFCESPLKRCRRYWLQGSRKDSVDAFIDNLPGFPDNIHFDGHSNYLIAISSSLHPYLDRLMKYPLVQKSMAIVARYISLHFLQKNGGIFVVDLEGNPVAHLYDSAMSQISSGIKVDNHLYIGSLYHRHITRFNLSNLI